MVSATQKYFGNARNFAAREQQKYADWATSYYSHVYSKLPAVSAFIKRNAFHALNAGRGFVWSHKELIAGGVIIGVALWAIHYYWKNRPQYPVVEMKSTLDVAALRIEIPKKYHAPPNVTLTFCIDKSTSMDTEKRMGAVKRALKTVLEDAQGVVNKSKEAQIAVAIIGFNSTSEVITPTTSLIAIAPGVANAAQDVEKQIGKLNCDGGTDILQGLDAATTELENMAKVNTQSSHTVVLLTDGEDNSLDTQKLSAIHARLASTQAQLFAIGIGPSHRKETLVKIAATNRGTYIDTTAGEDTIESAISKIYHQAIASFQEFELTTQQLAPGTWSVINTPTGNGQAKNLGSISEGESLVKGIKIHGDKLVAPLDLSKVVFSLTFTDPKGKKGKLSLPWNPNTTIDPTILSAAKSQ